MASDDRNTDTGSTARPRGFAALPPEQRRALARKGGRRAHALGRANRFTSESASAAGRIPHERGTAYRPRKRDAEERSSHDEGHGEARDSVRDATRTTDPAGWDAE